MKKRIDIKILCTIMFLIIFIPTMIFYSYNIQSLVVFHPFSMVVDILAIIAAIELIVAASIFYNSKKGYDYLLILQIMIAFFIISIHLARFIIRMIAA